MTKDEVKKIIGNRAFEGGSPYDCLFVGKYILVFVGGVLMKGCIIGDTTRPNGKGNIADDCSSCKSFPTTNRIRY